MRRLVICLLITVLTCSWLALPSSAITDAGIITDSQTVAITVTDNGLHVEETITVSNHGTDNVSLLRFWIQSEAKQDLSISATNSGTALSWVVNGNIRECNLTEKHLSIPPSSSFEVTISYGLPTNTNRFVKDLLYNTSQVTVTYNSQTLFSGTNFAKSNELVVQIYNPTEAPLGITTLVIVFLLVVIIITLLLLVLRRQRRKKRVGIVDTPEALTTKKDLLLDLLKELEKRYRAKTISDETYTKLKEEYKAQAVDTMRRLEDVQQ